MIIISSFSCQASGNIVLILVVSLYPFVACVNINGVNQYQPSFDGPSSGSYGMISSPVEIEQHCSSVEKMSSLSTMNGRSFVGLLFTQAMHCAACLLVEKQHSRLSSSFLIVIFIEGSKQRVRRTVKRKANKIEVSHRSPELKVMPSYLSSLLPLIRFLPVHQSTQS